MKKLSLSIFLIWTVNAQARAQETVALSLEQVMQLALENSEGYHDRLLDDSYYAEQLRQKKSRLYPQLSASADVRYNIHLPTTIIPGSITGNPGAEDIEVQFGRKWSTLATLELEQFVYDGVELAQMDITRSQQQLSRAEAQVYAEDIRMESVRRYIDVLFLEAQLEELRSSADRQQNTLETVEIRIAAQQEDALEMERARSDLAITEREIRKTQIAIESARNRLTSLVGLPPGYPIVLTDQMEPLSEEKIIPADTDTSLTYLKELPAYRSNNLKVSIAEEELALQAKYTLPAVSFYAQIGTQALGDRYNLVNPNAMPWFFQSFVGLRATWNVNRLFDNDLARSQLDLRRQQAALRLREQAETLQLAVLQARHDAMTAMEDLEIQKAKSSFAERERQYYQSRYSAGLATARDLTDAEQSLRLSRRSYKIAWYNYLLAWYEWRKTIGKL